ncbi:conserved hypothetical protein [Ricinus communis]|uniref:Uncharacterized protein n=1 Tax=Ricinus communis TaxID=3988 RepID=B9SVK2_RICCO|nr:conserved hypothetical protein [Ricinus communis]
MLFTSSVTIEGSGGQGKKKCFKQHIFLVHSGKHRISGWLTQLSGYKQDESVSRWNSNKFRNQESFVLDKSKKSTR